MTNEELTERLAKLEAENQRLQAAFNKLQSEQSCFVPNLDDDWHIELSDDHQLTPEEAIAEWQKLWPSIVGKMTTPAQLVIARNAIKLAKARRNNESIAMMRGLAQHINHGGKLPAMVSVALPTPPVPQASNNTLNLAANVYLCEAMDRHHWLAWVLPFFRG